MDRLTSSVSSVLRPINQYYFEPKQLNQNPDQLNLLNKNGNISDESITDDTDNDIELGLEHQINHKLHSSHRSLIDAAQVVIIDPDTTNSCHEWIKATAWRIKQSVQFFLVYLILIVLNAFVLLWEVTDGGDRRICIILEGIITLMFLGEVAVQIITEEWNNYWKLWLNRIDVIICILCVLLYIIFATVPEAPHSHYTVGNYMDAVLVGIRYGMQAIRLIRFATRGNENRRMLDQDQVKFDDKSTLSVLQQNGVRLPSKIKKTSDKSRNLYLSTIKKLKHRFFNPNVNHLEFKDNELKNLTAIEMISMDDDTVTDKDHDDDNNNDNNNDDISAPIIPSNQFNIFNINMNININQTPVDQQSDILYTTGDDLDSSTNNLKKYDFMYDSEQMAVYQNIFNDQIRESSNDPYPNNEYMQQHKQHNIL